MATKNTILAEIEAVTQEVQELLRKSEYNLHKDDDDASDEAPPSDDDEGADQTGDETTDESPEGDQADDDEEGAGHEMQDAVDYETPEQLSAEAENLSDKELDMLLECLMSEKESRAGSGEGMEEEGDMGSDEAGDDDEGEGDLAEKSMPTEYSKLGKSLERKNKKLKKSLKTLVDVVDSLAQKVEQLSSEKSPSKKIVSKAPAANTQDMQTLHKSAVASKRLTKSETVTYLENQLKKGNKLVNSEMMYDVNRTQNDSDLHKIQDQMVTQGIELPKL